MRVYKIYWPPKFILYFGIVLAMYSCESKKPKPMVGDVYTVQTEKNNYTTIKITKTTKSSIFYIKNDYSVSLKEFSDSINNPKNYTDEPIQTSYTYLKKLKKINTKPK